MLNLEELSHDYYQINGTKKILYWDGELWKEPIKDHYKRYTFLGYLEKQPKNIKTLTLASETEYAYLYRPFM
jgi:hypothetical protein